MSDLTDNLKLFKWNTTDETDLEQEFDIDKAMNDNWDKLDDFAERVNDAVIEIQDDIEEIQNKNTEQDETINTINESISSIQAKDESQDTEIDKQSDLIQKLKDNCINITTEEATSLHVTDASILPAKLDVRGGERQDGIPTPDTPVEVETVGDNGSVEVKKLTENVIDLSKSVALYNTEITEIDKENGIIKVHRTNTQNPSIEINCNLPAGQYTMLHNSHNFGQVSVYSNSTSVVAVGSEKYKTFYAEKGITKLIIYSGSELPTDYEINFSDIILVMGNVAREDIKYVKYQESSYILDIQQPMLSGDYFVKEADGWKEAHGWNNNTYDETDNFSVFVADDVFQFYLPTTISKNAILLCNMFMQKNDWTSTSVVVASTNNLYFLIKKGEYGFTANLTAEQALSKFKEIIATTNIVLYNTTTETKLTCTAEQSAVLNQLNELDMFKGTNNIITVDNLALLQLTYTVDTKAYIDSKLGSEG